MRKMLMMRPFSMLPSLKLTLGISAIALGLPLLTLPAQAFSVYTANLVGSQEVPPNLSTATGFGSVTLNDSEDQITVNLSWSNLSATAAAAHIHGPALPGTTSPVLFGFSNVPNVITGSIPQQSFTINSTQVNYLKSGLLYFNVHNTNYPSGEIRGQIQAVPEPMTILGSLAAIALSCQYERKQRKKS
jgi:hypothetical protein